MAAHEHAAILLALLWASLSNVSAAAFWAVSFLLLPEHHAARCELAAEIQTQGPDPALGDQEDHHGSINARAASVATVSGREDGLLQACVNEAIRLRAEGAWQPMSCNTVTTIISSRCPGVLHAAVHYH